MSSFFLTGFADGIDGNKMAWSPGRTAIGINPIGKYAIHMCDSLLQFVINELSLIFEAI